jgi:PAX-interacting protein 1
LNISWQNANDALLKEIKSINDTLIDTVVSISMDGIAPYDGGTTIKLSYSAVSLSPAVKSLFATSETVLYISKFRHFAARYATSRSYPDVLTDFLLMQSLVLPVKLFVPADYPSSSPVPISDEGDEVPR